MKPWFQKPDKSQVGDDKTLQWLAEPNWFPGDGMILMSENGSKHFDENLCKNCSLLPGISREGPKSICFRDFRPITETVMCFTIENVKV